MENSIESTNNSNSGKKPLLITVLIALAIIVSLWIWKAIEINNVKENAEVEKLEMKDAARKQVVNTHAEHLKLLAKPFVWAVRTEMLQGNMNQVNLYLNDMVKEKSFQSIVIADTKGKIILSTNKKDEGKPFSTIGKADFLSNNNTIVENIQDSILVMNSPIMSFNNRIGTLMVTYKIDQE